MNQPITDEDLTDLVDDAKRIATQEDEPDHEDLASMANSVWQLAGEVRRLRADLTTACADMREACAKACDGYGSFEHHAVHAALAAKIRALT